MENDLLKILIIGTGTLLVIITIINNIRINRLQKSNKFNIVKFNKLKKLVSIFNYTRFFYICILFIIAKYFNNINYTAIVGLIIFRIQIIFSIVIYHTTSSTKIQDKNTVSKS